MLNKVMFIGRLGGDPETFGSGHCKFSIASDYKWTSKDGDKEKDTYWLSCICFGKQGGFASDLLNKGTLVYIEGRLHDNKWKDKDGNKRSRTECIVARFTKLSWDDEYGADDDEPDEGDLPF